MSKDKKVLLVTGLASGDQQREYSIFRQLQDAGYESAICGHKDAIEQVTGRVYEIIIILECENDQTLAEEYTKGNKTYKLLRNSLPETVKIFRCGRTNQTEKEYLRLPFTKEKIIATFGEVNPVKHIRRPVILVVEDDPDQINAAKKALHQDYQTVIVTRLDEFKEIIPVVPVCGIITDLYLYQNAAERVSHDKPPAGLAVIAYAVEHMIPVVVCSYTDQHYAFYLEDVIAILANNRKYFYGPIQLSMDGKDWDEARECFRRTVQIK